MDSNDEREEPNVEHDVQLNNRRTEDDEDVDDGNGWHAFLLIAS